MKLFILDLLECTNCKTKKRLSVNIENLEIVSPPSTCILNSYRNEKKFLNSLVDSLERYGADIVKASDVAEFIDNPGDEYACKKMEELLYCVEVVEGCVKCTECGLEKKIKNKILFWVDED